MRLFTLITATLFTLMTLQPAQAQSTPLQCTGFETEVSCNKASGLWEVQLSNSAHPSFSPSEVEISTAATVITIGQSSMDPTLITLSGASAGDQFRIRINAIEQGAGGAPGLDLCCMGDIDISIPRGEQCIPQPPDRDLDVVKECGPIGYEDPFGSNMECTFTITYSGPPPTPDNPITISDALTSGGPMTIQSSWPPSGADSLWNCPDTPVTGAYTCTMDNTLDTDQSAGYWNSYSSSFTIQTTMDDPYRNCLDGQINSAAGAPVTSQSCTQEGDFELVVKKRWSRAAHAIRVEPANSKLPSLITAMIPVCATSH